MREIKNIQKKIIKRVTYTLELTHPESKEKYRKVVNSKYAAYYVIAKNRFWNKRLDQHWEYFDTNLLKDYYKLIRRYTKSLIYWDNLKFIGNPNCKGYIENDKGYCYGLTANNCASCNECPSQDWITT